ncbi:hypothetical protein COMA1_90022 [Candidatus Nitrospira nitrosa]|uniref:Uncharacterized protein n=1 Tax=Candidatus Nitrospira nitrosa TaxID=1742972 RepID=A0A0S4LR09_9BACT|nr:hypothetical protein COMA1_90022 [Candidatus Nitrospira nitrosa]
MDQYGGENGAHYNTEYEIPHRFAVRLLSLDLSHVRGWGREGMVTFHGSFLSSSKGILIDPASDTIVTCLV